MYNQVDFLDRTEAGCGGGIARWRDVARWRGETVSDEDRRPRSGPSPIRRRGGNV